MSEQSHSIEALRERHKEALARLKEARDDGDGAEIRAWEAAFKRISALRQDAGDDPNAPIW